MPSLSVSSGPFSVRKRTEKTGFSNYAALKTPTLKGPNMKILHLSLRRLTRATASALVCMAAAMPVMADTANEAQARYRQDMAACNNGQSSQDPATCRLEARNALAEARRGGLTDPPGQYQGNALHRSSGRQPQ